MMLHLRLCVLLALYFLQSYASPTGEKNLAPLKIASGVRLCDGNYFVQLRENHTVAAHFQNIGVDLSHNSSIRFHPITILDGYRAQLESQTLLDLVRQDPGVEYVSQNYYTSDGPDHIDEEDEPNDTTTNTVPSITRRFWMEYIIGASWPNTMISAGEKLPGHVRDHGDWIFSSEAGLGVDIYILDSGINISHEDFGGRASHFKGAAVSNHAEPPETRDDVEEQSKGHGTHVVGIAVADIYGAAPHANTINVKVEGAHGASLRMVAQGTSRLFAFCAV